jgi:1-acyl-sn-glycerol-3-phosphate acyltransferase
MTASVSAKRQLRPRYFSPPGTYRALRAVTAWIMRLLYRWDVRGLENAPASGATIIVVNHLHLLDPFAVAPYFTRQIVTLATDKWKRNLLVRTILRWAGVIFVKRGEVDREALKDCLEVLKAGNVLAIAPEGTRSRRRGLQQGKPGVSYLAMRSNAVIVPVVYWGIERLREWAPWRRPLVHVVIGKPFRLPKTEGKVSTDQLEELTELVMLELGRLLPESYRGIYTERIAQYEAGTYKGPAIIPA